MKVQRILQGKSHDVITIPCRANLRKASQLLEEYNIGVLLVNNREGQPIGILSERDIVREFARLGAASETVSVEDIMIKDLIVGAPDDDLNYVMNVMTQQRIRHLPIIDGDQQLVGLISIGDVVKAQLSVSEAEIKYLTAYITGTP